MVIYYFEDIEKQKELLSIMESWLGTKYKHHVGVKGMGCDCIHFVAGVLHEMELLKIDSKLPDYPRDWHLHNTRELLKDNIIKYLNGDFVESTDYLNGDIILSHYGKAASHAGIFYDGYVYQSLDHIGVRKINVSDAKMKKQYKFIYRVKK